MDIKHYEDFALVGAGGNAHVYSATHCDTGETVAVKILRGGGDEAVTRRFERERQAMSTLESLDHVAPVLESGITPGGDPYIVMPLFDGGSLQQLVSKGPLPWREALILSRKVARAVAQAHERRILHLDIKPANVLLDTQGQPFLADFGISEAMGTTASMSAQMMTPAYTPPERLNGAKPSEHTDVYGLGGLLFALVSGRAPFVLEEGMTPAAMFVAVLNEDVVTDHLVDQVPPAVVDLIARTLSKEIEDRPERANDFAHEIDEILADEVLKVSDPVIGFSVAEQSAASESGLFAGSPGEVESAATSNQNLGFQELRSEPAEPLFSGDALLATGVPVPLDEEDDDDRMVAMWVMAALVFVAVGILGAITATVSNRDEVSASTRDGAVDLDDLGDGRASGVRSADDVDNDEVDNDDNNDDDDDEELDSISASVTQPFGSSESVTALEPSGQTVTSVGEGNDGDANRASESGNLGPAVVVQSATPASAVPTEVAGIQLPTAQNPTAQAPTSQNPPVQGPAVPTSEQDSENSPVNTGGQIASPFVADPTTTTAAPTTTTTEAPTTTTTAAPTTTTTEAPTTTTTAAPTTTTTEAPTTTTTAAPTTTTSTTTTTAAPVLTEPLEFEERIDIANIGENSVSFRFTTSDTTGYTATVRSNGVTVASQSGTAFGGILEGLTFNGLTSGTDYSVQVTLNGNPSVSSTVVDFRTSGGTAPIATTDVEVQNLRLDTVGSSRFQVNYESNICANGSFVIRTLAGAFVGSNNGQAVGCTTRHLAIPGFWTPGLSPNTTYVITVTVEANGQGEGNGNTASQSLTVTTGS